MFSKVNKSEVKIFYLNDGFVGGLVEDDGTIVAIPFSLIYPYKLADLQICMHIHRFAHLQNHRFVHSQIYRFAHLPLLHGRI